MFNIFKNKDFLCFNADSENAQSKSDMTTKQECGRSMVEMIGVLVLIGLFTIGGVVGYKTAFDTYRATSIMDTVLKGKLAVEADYRVAGKSTLVRAINNGPIADVNDKVEYYTEVACGNRQCKEYVIKTKEPAGVCEKIVLRQSLYNSSDESDNTPEIYITPNNIEDCGEEGEVDMTFTFQIPMLKAGDGSDVYEPVDGTLQESTCPAGQIIIDGVCQCRPACDRGEGVCVCCNTGYEYDNETKSCICPAGTHDTGSDCITCENGTKWDETKKQCENPCTDGKIWNGTTCIDLCSGGKEWDSSANTCVCPEGTNDNGESCVTCSAPKTHWDNELNKCTCPTGFVERNGTCERKPTCTEPRTVYDEASNTCQCPSERPEYDEDKNTCNCPEATPYWDSTKNQCVTCVVGNSNTPVWNGTSCVSCAGADNTKPYWNGTECISCYANNPTTPYWNGTNCTTCPNTTPVWNGTACVSCAEADSTKPVWNSTECVACPTETPYWNGTSCVSCYDNNQTTPYWNGTNCTVCPDAKLWNTESNQCVQCLDNENCSGSTPVCNDNNVCESCPDVMPIWHTDMKQCVQCLENEDCNDNATPVCNNSNMCESCPDAMPVWHTDMKQCVQCLENADCPTGTPVCNATNACEPCPDETPIWVAETGKCIASDGPSGDGSCNDNSDCSVGEYCDITTWGTSKDYCTTDTSNMSGTCRNATDDIQSPNSGTTPAFVISNRPMYWWSANNFCQALGKVLAEVSDFECAHTICPECSSGTCPDGCDGYYGYCHQDDSLGLTTSDGVNISPIVVQMTNAYGNLWGWLNTKYNDCMAYDISLQSGEVNRYNRKGTNPAICKDRPSCPIETPYWNGTECTTCPIETPYWNEETDQCEVCPAETPIWDGTTCIEGYVCKGTTSECQTNNDCTQLYGSGYYCNIECFTDHCSTETTSLGGSCRKAISDVKEPNSGTTPPFVMSSEKMYWWSAKNFCQALGQRLVDVTDYECAHAICPDDNCDNAWGFCHADTSHSVVGGNTTNISAKIAAMKEAYGSYYCWVDMDYNSCRPYFTNFNQGLVTFGYRNNRYYAVCESVCEGDTPVWNGTACEACPTGTLWNEATGECVAALCKGVVYECNDNADCDAGEYCNITCYNDTCTKDTSGMGGTCQNANERIQPPENGTKPPFIMSNQPMTWWNANNFCEALGTTLVEVSDYACAHSICPSGCDATYGYCHADPSQSVTLSFATNDRTAKLQAMYEAYGSNISYGWTNTDTDDLCYAYNVSFYQGGMFNGLRYSSVVNAVCKPDCAATDVTKPYWTGTSCEACPTDTFWDAEKGECVDMPICVLNNCRWTGWIDRSQPESDNTGGDYETLDGLCVSGKIQNISCRSVWFPNTSLDDLDQVLESCDTVNGLVCLNEKNYVSEPGGPRPPGMACYNYEINVFCCSNCKECTANTDCPGDYPYCDSGVCMPCPTGTPVWNGTSCEACPMATPIWDSELGQCVTCAEADSTKPVWNEETNQCEACPTETVWDDEAGVCIVQQCKGVVYACNDNNDCGAGEYCDITCYDNHCTEDMSGMGGTCRNVQDDLNDKSEEEPFWVSDRYMNWWSAKNFCQGLGKQMISLDDLECAHPMELHGYCHEDTSTDVIYYNPLNISDKVSRTFNAYGSIWGWMESDSYAPDNCYTRMVNFSNGYVRFHLRYIVGGYAICKDRPACPTETPYWDGSVCVAECPSDKPVIGENNVCEACPADKPEWTGTECIYCPDTSTWDEEWNACTFTIELESYSACNNDCGASQVVEKFSVSNLEASYDTYFTGYADDWFWICESYLSNLDPKNECMKYKYNMGLRAGGTKTNMFMGITYAGEGATKGYWHSYQGIMRINGTMTFVYNPDIKMGEYCPVGYYCSSDGNSVATQCINETITENIAETDCHVCDIRFWREDDGSCIYCETEDTQTKIEQSECNRCTNRFWKDNNYCYHCSISGVQSGIMQNECERCSNRYWLETNAETHIGSCTLCPDGLTRDNATGLCVCDEGLVFNLGTKKCVSCTETTGNFSSTELSTEQSCPATRFYANDEKSYLCSGTGTYPVTTEENCMVCGDDVNRFWKSKNGYCISCNYSTAVAETTKEECLTCVNRYWTETNATTGIGKCTKCAVGQVVNADGTACVSCAEADSTKPVWNGTACVSCAEADSTKPVWNGTACEACPTDKPTWSGTECYNEATAQNCQTAMTSAGFSTSKFTMDGTTIKYTGDMTLSKDLDISACNLDVVGTLKVNSGKTLKVNNVKAESTGIYSIFNSGTIEVTNITGIATGTASYGIHNTSGTIEATGDVMGTGTATGINNYGAITATNVTGSGSAYADGISNVGTITATGDVTGTGNYGIYNNRSGKITATNVTGTGIGTNGNGSGIQNTGTIEATGDVTGTGTGVFYGIYNSGTIETRDEVTGTGNQYGIMNTGTLETTGDVTGTSTGTGSYVYDISNSGTMSAINVYYCRAIKNTGKIIGHIQCKCPEGMSCPATTITQCTAPTPVLSGNLTTCVACATADSTKPNWNGMTCEACPTETPAWNGTACETCPAETPVWNGTTCESCPSGTSWSGTECIDMNAFNCQTAMTSAGFSTSNFTMEGTTIKYTGDMTVATDLDISGCNLDVAGTLTVNGTLEVNNINAESSGDKGIDNYGRIIATGNITGTGTSEGVYNNGGQIEAQNITGTGTNYDGIYNAGAMDAQNITGTGGMYGIENFGGFITVTGDISGTGNYDGIYNWIGTMSATNVYYCQTINSTAGQIIGNVACGCSDSSSCTSDVMQCTAPTPILIGLESCISCADADSTKPYWNGTSCEACPTDKPTWNGTECVNEEIIAQNCQTAMTSAGFSTDDFTMDGITIKYTGYMIVSTDLDISACNLDVDGTLIVNSETTLKVNNVKAEGEGSDRGISNYGGTIKATNVMGSGNNFGIYNGERGTIEATNVTGTGTNVNADGISNDGTIKATGDVTGTGTGTDSKGINNDGTITATGDVTGIGNDFFGIDNDGTITATNVYYCATIYNSGTINVTPQYLCPQ